MLSLYPGCVASCLDWVHKTKYKEKAQFIWHKLAF